MLFNSWGYVLFLLLAVPTHWLLPHRWRVAALGVYSVLFYSMWRWEFTLLVIFSACVDFFCSRRIFASNRPGVRRSWLLVSLVINLGLLVFFKYTYFICDNLRLLGSLLRADIPGPRDLGLEIILPLGISFYTFQTISYTIDVYRGVAKPTASFWVFLTYVTFWPQLIAGPILRAGEVIPQLQQRRRFDIGTFSQGLVDVLAGLFKKVVLADTIASLVDTAFATNVSTLNAFDVWVASFLFGFQIYFDFSGYSQIAIGSARMVGMDFPANFNWPYMAVSPRDFWNRWHISLSSWIRDYLYLPLTGQHFHTDSTGGLAVAAEARSGRRHRALLLTWFIMGLWHGAAWTFAVWGIYHAVTVLCYRVFTPLRRLPERAPALAWAVMLPIAMAGWIPFRAHSLRQMLAMFGKILNPLQYTIANHAVHGYSYLTALVVLAGMVGVYFVNRLPERRPVPQYIRVPAIGMTVGVMVFMIIMMLRPVSQFIYFQF